MSKIPRTPFSTVKIYTLLEASSGRRVNPKLILILGGGLFLMAGKMNDILKNNYKVKISPQPPSPFPPSSITRKNKMYLHHILKGFVIF